MMEKKEIETILSLVGIGGYSASEDAKKMKKYVNGWCFGRPAGRTVNESFSVESENLIKQIEL